MRVDTKATIVLACLLAAVMIVAVAGIVWGVTYDSVDRDGMVQFKTKLNGEVPDDFRGVRLYDVVTGLPLGDVLFETGALPQPGAWINFDVVVFADNIYEVAATTFDDLGNESEHSPGHLVRVDSQAPLAPVAVERAD